LRVVAIEPPEHFSMLLLETRSRPNYEKLPYCNRWGKPGDENLVLELLEDDLEALRQQRPRSAGHTVRPGPCWLNRAVSAGEL
jgi:hypothetical protein